MRRFLAAALAATILAPGAAMASDDPGWSYEPAPRYQPNPYTTMAVRLKAILTADDDGTHAATVSPNQIANAVAYTNQVWAGSDIVLQFDPAQDVEYVDSTLLNNDCTPIPGRVWYCDKQPNAEAREAFALDAAHDGKVVVFHRWGREECDDNGQNCALVQATGAYSGRAGHSVVQVGYAASGSSYSHELGHYFWNAHTFGKKPADETQAKQMIKDYVLSENVHPSKGLDVFDGDGLSDTPPDPGSGFWKAVKGDACSTAPGADSHQLTVQFSGDPIDVWTYTLQPDRTNTMSYFKGCFTNTTTPMQRQNMKTSVLQRNRGVLVGTPPDYAAFTAKWKPGLAADATAVTSFFMNRREHLVRYRSNGSVQIDRLDDDAKGLTTTWSGTWSLGYTRLVPFELGGVPHLLVYKNGNGTVRILKVNAGASGFTTLWSGNWGSNWTFMPYEISGQPYVLCYNTATGQANFDRIRPDAQGVWVLGTKTWATGWTKLMPFVMDGKPHLVGYRPSTGQVNVDRISDDGSGFTVLKTLWFPQGRTHLVPFDRGATPRFLSYDSASGAMDVHAIAADATVATIESVSWPSGDDVMLPLRHMGLWYVFSYDAQGGAAAFRYITQ